MTTNTAVPEHDEMAAIRAILDDPLTPHDLDARLQSLIAAGCGDLPLPGSGQTLSRWQALAAVSEHDLALAKCFESHADALAILAELAPDGRPAPVGLWAVWCAEPPERRVRVVPAAHGAVRIHGTKAWCSGAAQVSHAIVSGWDEADRACLVRVDMAQPQVRVTEDGWHAVGMARTASVDVVFDGATGWLVGGPGDYVARPGFHHGGAGIAACWYGAACAIAEQVRQTARRRADDVHALAHLGAIDVALAQARGLLREAAAQIDATPEETCAHAVRRARLAAEAAAETLLLRAPRAIGAGPLCKDARLARLLADLPVFIRQSHAERDLATHGLAVTHDAQESPWTL